MGLKSPSFYVSVPLREYAGRAGQNVKDSGWSRTKSPIFWGGGTGSHRSETENSLPRWPLPQSCTQTYRQKNQHTHQSQRPYGGQKNTKECWDQLCKVLIYCGDKAQKVQWVQKPLQEDKQTFQSQDFPQCWCVELGTSRHAKHLPGAHTVCQNSDDLMKCSQCFLQIIVNKLQSVNLLSVNLFSRNQCFQSLFYYWNKTFPSMWIKQILSTAHINVIKSTAICYNHVMVCSTAPSGDSFASFHPPG